MGLSFVFLGFAVASYAALTEEQITQINTSIGDILAQLSSGSTTEDQALAQLEELFNQQVLPNLDLPEGETVDFASLIPAIQETFAMVTSAMEGGGDLNSATAAATESLSQILTNPTSNPGGSIRGSTGEKEGKEKEEKEEEPPPPAEPTIQGTILGVEEIDGKTYVKVEADKINIADKNGFVDAAEGEIVLVEIDEKTAAELSKEIGKEIIISGDLQKDVNGYLTLILYTKEYLKERYGIETDTDKFYAVGNDIDKYIAEMNKEGSWFKQMEKLMAPLYQAIEAKFGKLSYKEKLEIIKQVLLGGASKAAELIGKPDLPWQK